MSRLPIVGGDAGTWGTVLNDFLSVSHNTDGTLKDASITSSALGSGTANNTTYLRGDRTWQPIPTGVAWSVITGSTTASNNSGYFTNSASLITVTLPASATVGSIIELSAMGTGGWKVAQNASQILHFGTSNTTTGSGGYLQSTARYDSIKLVCNVADTEWVVVSSVGNITVV